MFTFPIGLSDICCPLFESPHPGTLSPEGESVDRGATDLNDWKFFILESSKNDFISRDYLTSFTL